MSHKTHAWLTVYLIVLVFSLAIIWRTWNTLDIIFWYVGSGMALIAALGLLYTIIRLFLDLNNRLIENRARHQHLRLEAETHSTTLAREQARMEIERQRADREAELAYMRFQLEQHLALTRVMPDELGNYAAILSANVPLTTITSGNAPHPGRLIGKNTVQVSEEPGMGKGMPQLVAANMRQPKQETLIAQLQPNSLEVSPGIHATTGEIVKLNIVDAVHFKIIGSSGFGKSCLAAALLDQATQANTPDVLQIALLDLEHKTSRLFEHLPHVLSVTVGKRRVELVATDANEVAEHLTYLRRVLAHRAMLPEEDLQRLPVLLIYVEEMLSLQYEVDDKLKARMLADLSVLALRARKYNMFLLACSQTDYSTEELKSAQKQFRSRMAFAVDVTAARAAGFMNTDLVKYNFMHSEKGSGQFVLEAPGIASLMLAPVFDVRQRLLQPSSSAQNSAFNSANVRHANVIRTVSEQGMNNAGTDDEHSWQAKGREVRHLRVQGWGKIAIIEKVWGVKRGGTERYRQAEKEYETIVATHCSDPVPDQESEEQAEV